MKRNLAIDATGRAPGKRADAGERPDIGIEHPVIVTTSWDDGDPLDLGVASLLTEFNLPGTFYIPVRGHHRSARMGRADMQSLDAQGFEIGAHGVSHPNLTQCSELQLAVEVESSKKRLEDDLGRELSMFAYPRGRYSPKVIAAVKQAGFEGARTTAMLARELTFDPYRMPTSLQVFPHSKSDYIRNLARAGDLNRAWNFLTKLRNSMGWVDLAMDLFDSVLEQGGVWHLYGHSWEIGDLKLWEGLRVVLEYVSKRPGVKYLPNGEIVEFGGLEPGIKMLCSHEPAL
jgi:peptidoglycan/xylan/chitin deacetylase (PgdA/CDA1 family)